LNVEPAEGNASRWSSVPEANDAVQSLLHAVCGERTDPEPETTTWRVRWTGGATDGFCGEEPEHATAAAASATQIGRMCASGRPSV